ncbi:MAG: 16S rRNA (cytosine(967)-C(5))-methyltransferase RsmB [Candidatus Porifericomitaceae bacterium WSBS_2022_MAG_OTU9]
MANQSCAKHKPSDSTNLHDTVAAAAQLLHRVSNHGESFALVLADFKQKHNEPALLQQICYGTLRWWPRLLVVLEKLLHRPLSKLEPQLQCLLLAGLYQLQDMRIPPHAVVQSNVEACRKIGCQWACGLVNAVLRGYLRQKPTLEKTLDNNPAWRYSHPDWLLQMLQQQWPSDWQEIANQGNQQPPMHLRINTKRLSRDNWLQQADDCGMEAQPLAFCPQGVQLQQPVAVTEIPGFDDGIVSVQDGAAQQSASLLAASASDIVLDACSAPGGKIAHLLEQTDFDNRPICLERSMNRIQQLRQTLERTNLIDKVVLCHGDASQPKKWWNGQKFTRIMLDAPCGATGVIRRNPDIKLRHDDSLLNTLSINQQAILQSLWPLLAPGGRMVYITCSILKQENDDQIETFLRHTADATNCTPTVAWARSTEHGMQTLPGDNGMDGFYYACFEKKAPAP